jgi:succinate dehydrogenase/fumarate reductase flavoprotein subunit
MPGADSAVVAGDAPGDAAPREVTFAIIGTGFAGLGAAIALRRAGYPLATTCSRSSASAMT